MLCIIKLHKTVPILGNLHDSQSGGWPWFLVTLMGPLLKPSNYSADLLNLCSSEIIPLRISQLHKASTDWKLQLPCSLVSPKSQTDESSDFRSTPIEQRMN